MELNLFDQGVVANPFPLYEQLRDEGDVVWNDLFGAWMIGGYEAVQCVLKQPELFSSKGLAQMGTDRVEAFGDAEAMLFTDPPDHDRLRAVVQRAFTPRAVARLGDRVRDIVRELLEPVRVGRCFDLIGEVAYPLPVIVIAEMLGVAVEDRPLFKRWSDDIVDGINEFAGIEAQERARLAARELRSYLSTEIAKRRHHRSDDLIGSMVQANEEEGLLSDGELLASCVLLLVAGNETTTKFIGNAVLALAEQPEVRSALAAGYASPFAKGIEELLRFVGPAQATMRVAAADTEIAGTPIAEGQMIFVMLGAANRDPTVFANPLQLMLDRYPNPHLAFGHGIHFCIGATTARLESQFLLEGLLRLAPNYKVLSEAGALKYSPSFFLRGLRSLPIDPCTDAAAVR